MAALAYYTAGSHRLNAAGEEMTDEGETQPMFLIRLSAEPP
jgi:hypothetical protein